MSNIPRPVPFEFLQRFTPALIIGGLARPYEKAGDNELVFHRRVTPRRERTGFAPNYPGISGTNPVGLEANDFTTPCISLPTLF